MQNEAKMAMVSLVKPPTVKRHPGRSESVLSRRQKYTLNDWVGYRHRGEKCTLATRTESIAS